jgi:2-phospho-L-lactate transferase/gluconeogenesis factor (CofD/UPF0052 family)
LKDRGIYGEVSHIEFWSWEKLCRALEPNSERSLASGTFSAMTDKGIRKKVHERCKNIRSIKRNKFRNRHLTFKKFNVSETAYDEYLIDLFIENPSKKASNILTSEIFYKGKKQQAGAYIIGMMRNQFAGDPYWEAKYNDPKDRYVDNLLNAISYGLNSEKRNYLIKIGPEIKSFVSDLLELPMANGNRFRDTFGNLVDISVARNAVLKWIDHDSGLVDKNKLAYPTQNVTIHCLEAGEKLFLDCSKRLPDKGFDRLLELLKHGLEASPVDFNNPKFQENLKRIFSYPAAISKFLRNIAIQDLAPELGGNKFLHDFYTLYIKNSPTVKIAYLPGTVSQAAFSLSICQEILIQNKNAKIAFIPKKGHPGNDLSYNETLQLLERMSNSHLIKLKRFQNRLRFSILDDGPMINGLDPCRLHENTVRSLSHADVIVAEGQAYAELRGWKKPVYIAFRVNGRIAKAIHGDSLAGRTGFVRLTPGVDHYKVFDYYESIRKNSADFKRHTTSEYVEAILHENLSLVVKKLFYNDWDAAIEKIKNEAKFLKKPFPEVIIGHASHKPDAFSIRQFKERRYPIFACGGGGGFCAVTLRALRLLGMPTIAGVPSTDDGGSTGELQRALSNKRGFIFGVGDMASIIQDSLDNKGKEAILSYRFSENPPKAVQGVIKRIEKEIRSNSSPLGSADDLISFTCDQLNLARIIDNNFRSNHRDNLNIEGASIRNLNVIAAFELCDSLGDGSNITDDQRIAALVVLEKALSLPESVMALPVTFDECTLYLDYFDSLSHEMLENLPHDAFDIRKNRIYGQKFIDKLPQPGKRKMVGVIGKRNKKPKASKEYLRRLQEADLIVMGAGSLISSQLSQLATPGVIDEFLNAQNKRRILVLNHVKMDETLDMTVSDHIRLIEDLANKISTTSIRNKLKNQQSCLKISDLFTDIVIPRTVAREIEEAMKVAKYKWQKPASNNFEYLQFGSPEYKGMSEIFCNKYVDFLRRYPNISSELKITRRELEILSFLDQPAELYSERSEKGRYRGALFATEEDIKYLTHQGIQRRNIHEVDAIGKNIKFIKSKGNTRFEYFPGLIPQSLMGIFQLALEKGMAIP